MRFKTTADFNKPLAPGYNTFYTTSTKVEYFNADRLEGKSGYLNYVPTDDITEQKLEKLWFDNINWDINEKRT